ncbi:type II toxin-antitoxin system RelE/ParE family toxin [Candidatus Woesearchaeota archaeon]|nr:type II toxin-antitoxin system RelE/ParE family toxin [Candidatus Woesearchaeota archaeon]
MVTVEFSILFERRIQKIRNSSLKDHIKKQIKKIIDNPEIGKPMRYERKGTRELYVAPFRLSYVFIKEQDKIIFLEIYHKDEQ